MALKQIDLINRLTLEVPARNDVPSEPQYAEAVNDAILDFSQRVPVQKTGTLALLAGQAAYELPDDFISLIDIENPAIYDAGAGIVFASSGLVPVGPSYEQEYTVQGQQITFSPAPMFPATRTIRYSAYHKLDNEQKYPYLTFIDLPIIALKARANALAYQTVAESGDAISFSIGDESIDKRGGVAAMQEQIKQITAQYEQAVARRVGTVAMRSTQPLQWDPNGDYGMRSDGERW